MAKPDPALLDIARYPFHVSMQTRFGDLDVNMHVNNVALIGILEDSRVRFHAASGFHIAMDGWTAMVASLTIEYLAQMYYPEPLDVHCGAASFGRTSYRINQLVTQGERVVAFADAVMVCVRDGKGFPIPDSFRTSAQTWRLLP